MASKNSSPNERNLSLLCKQISKNWLIALKYSLLLKVNPDWLTQNYSGDIPEAILLGFIDVSCNSLIVQKTLSSLIDVVQPECITDKVFKKIINYPDINTRELLITCMAHKKLTEAQLIQLCDVGSEFECFFELALLYYRDDNYSVDLLAELLKKFKNSRFGYMYSELLDELFYCEIFTEKKQKWVAGEKQKKTGDGLCEP